MYVCMYVCVAIVPKLETKIKRLEINDEWDEILAIHGTFNKYLINRYEIN